MSMIVHRCRFCGRPDHWAPQADRPIGQTVDGRTCHWEGWTRPQLLPTFGRDGKPQPDVAVPGQPYGEYTGAARPCGCDECWELYRQLTRQPARL